MLEFNVGELATRLRRALGVRGRMPLGLDEHVVPVTLTADVSGPPWRTNPVFAQGAFIQETAVVGQQSSIHLTFETAPIRVNSSSFVITGWSMQPLNKTTATGVAITGNAALAYWKPNQLVTARVSLITTERQNVPVGASLDPWRIPVGFEGVGIVVPPAPTDPGVLQYVESGGVQPPVPGPSQTILRPGQSIVFASTHIATATTSSGLAVSVQGLFYGLGG